jgi:SAM-dependent methyltransferase
MAKIINLKDITFNSEFGIRGDLENLKDLPQYEIPEAKGIKVVSFNKKGFMKTELDEFSKEFIEYSIETELPVLEIGALFGAATIPLLKKGKTVIANDISAEHLSALYHNAPKEHLDKLYLNLKSFPFETEFPDNSLQAILVCRIAHFLTGEEILEGFKRIHKWLAPGGRFYFVALSPYHHLLREKFLPIYLEKLEKGEEWPGIIENMQEYNPKEAKDIPNLMHAFEERIMEPVLAKSDFIIKNMKKFDYSTNNSNGIGYLGFVAEKPHK